MADPTERRGMDASMDPAALYLEEVFSDRRVGTIRRMTPVKTDGTRDMARPVTGKEQIAQVATLSAHDSEMGEMIAEVMEKVGKDGVITVEEGRGLKYETEFVDGLQLDRGYVSPYFSTNNERMEAEIDDPYILITDKKISAVADILPVLERVLGVTKNFVILADDVDAAP